MKKISVIVPIYNVENYIEKCIESIVNQTYKNLEIILVNDGSEDNSVLICEKWLKKDKRIILFHKENGGLSDARNYALDRASGEYLVFVDSDDFIELDMLEKLYLAVTKNDSDVAICGFKNIYENYETSQYLTLNNEKIVTGKSILKQVFTPLGYVYVVVWNKIYKKDIFKNLRFDKGKIYEDEFINFRIFYNITKVTIVNECLYNYRQREGSIINSEFNIHKFYCNKEFQKLRIDFYKEKNDLELLNLAAKEYLRWSFKIINEKGHYFTEDIKKELVNDFRKVYKLTKYNFDKHSLMLFIRSTLAYINLEFTVKLNNLILKIFKER